MTRGSISKFARAFQSNSEIARSIALDLHKNVNYVFYMSVEVSSTEAVRSFAELLARVRYGGEEIIIRKNDALVAKLSPLGTARRASLGDFLRLWTPESGDSAFADDLERVNRSDTPPHNPWDL
jgi:antitoxin (DNA-binding transcriptional repressor) of toxin-antitoxin stability system